MGGLGLAGAAAGTLYGATEIYKGLWRYGDRERSHEHIDDIDYDSTDTYDEDRDAVTYTADPERDPVDTWNEALPGECELETDERHWLVGRVDSYDNLEGDNFFEYVGDEVRLYDRGSELRMEVDSDFDGGEFEPERGYNIPDAC